MTEDKKEIKTKVLTVETIINKIYFLTEELNKTRLAAARDKQGYKEEEAKAWLTLDFKAHGATNEKTRNALVRDFMNRNYVATYISKEAKVENLKSALTMYHQMLDTMVYFDLKEIEIETDNKQS